MFKKIVWLWFQTKWKNKKEAREYIKKMIEMWATEFFTWYTPSYWSEKFGFEVSPNGRFSEHEQITDYETLKEIVDEVHKNNFEIFINLNAWYYTDITFPFIKKMVGEFEELWVDGIICWNITILEYLKEIWYKWKINLSTILALYNTESIRFFLENYNINKVILSREITIKEIENLVTTFPDLKFEVFWEGDFCRYNNWLCFAEHKYATRDICTVVLDDLVYKKRFRADFKKIVLDKNLDEISKLELFDDDYKSIFEIIEDIISKIETDFFDNEKLIDDLEKIYNKSINRVDLYYDAMKWIQDTWNKNILTYYKWLKFLVEKKQFLQNRDIFLQKIEFLKENIKKWMSYFLDLTKKLNWETKITAKERQLLYSKWDDLNLFSYIFFSKFKNIETVKFPTRWRAYQDKLKIIEEVLQDNKKVKNYITLSSSLKRTHYDLSYIFWDKNRFYDLLKEL